MELTVDVKVVVTKNIDVSYLRYEREGNVIVREVVGSPCTIAELVSYKLPILTTEYANSRCWNDACDFLGECLGRTFCIDCSLNSGFHNSDGRTIVDSKITFLDKDYKKVPDVEFVFKTLAKARGIEKNVVPSRIQATTKGLVA